MLKAWQGLPYPEPEADSELANVFHPFRALERSEGSRLGTACDQACKLGRRVLITLNGGARFLLRPWRPLLATLLRFASLLGTLAGPHGGVCWQTNST